MTGTRPLDAVARVRRVHEDAAARELAAAQERQRRCNHLRGGQAVPVTRPNNEDPLCRQSAGPAAIARPVDEALDLAVHAVE